MTFVSPDAKLYKKQVSQLAGSRPLIYAELSITVHIFRPQRSGDLDNRLKVLLDSLQGVIYADDKQITELHAFRFEDKKNPRVEVEIRTIGLLTKIDE